jgi:hypothetical protein
MSTKPFVKRSLLRLAVLAAAAIAGASCGDVVRSSRSPSMLVVDSLGGDPATTLSSDVVDTTTAPCSVASPCVSADTTEATLGVVMKDVTVSPTTNNQVTVSRYHVSYRRTDGRNTPGVDVPYGFDGAATTTIPANANGTLTFQIVRQDAKLEQPLVTLRGTSTVISAIADVTFFGADQVGNDVSVTGSVLINFGNFSDK